MVKESEFLSLGRPSNAITKDDFDSEFINACYVAEYGSSDLCNDFTTHRLSLCKNESDKLAFLIETKLSFEECINGFEVQILYNRDVKANQDKVLQYRQCLSNVNIRIHQVKQKIDECLTRNSTAAQFNINNTNGFKSDFIHVINTLYDLDFFRGLSNKQSPTKKDLFESLGSFFGQNWSTYQKDLGQKLSAKKDETAFKIFETMKSKVKELRENKDEKDRRK